MSNIINQNSSTTVSYTAAPGVTTVPGGATVTISGKNLKPAPFVTLSVEQYKAEEYVIGGILLVQLKGTVVGENFADVSSQIIEILKLGGDGDCHDIKIDCNGSILVDGKGRIRSVGADEGPMPSWVNIAPYTIDIEVFENNGELVVKPDTRIVGWITDKEAIKDVSESISLAISDESYAVDDTGPLGKVGKAHAKCTFNLSATGAGANCATASGIKIGLEAAEEVIKRRLQQISLMEWDAGTLGGTQIHSELASYKGGYYHLNFRNVEINTFAGSITVGGELIWRPAACQYPHVFIDVNVDSKADSSGSGRTVTISGNVQGISADTYDEIIRTISFPQENNSRMPNAEDAFGRIKTGFEALANQYVLPKLSASTQQNDLCNIPPEPEKSLTLTSKTETRQFSQATIAFNYEYTTKPTCTIEGASKVEIDAIHEKPTDVVVEHTVIGRGYPLIQNLNTKTRETWSLTVTITRDVVDCGSVAKTGLMENCAIGILEVQCDLLGCCDWYITTDTADIQSTGTVRVNRVYLRPSCFPK